MVLSKTQTDILQRLVSGESVASSALRKDVASELLDEGLLTVKTHGSRRSYAAIDAEALRKFVESHYGGFSFVGKDGLTRAEMASETGNSKLVMVRSCPGFPVNSYEPIACMLNDREFIVNPQEGSFVFVADWQEFKIPEDVIVVGIENMENFRLIRQQRELFEQTIGSQRLLFVSRYPQSTDLRSWLQMIPNRSIHFGDFDLAGINIFLTEFYAYLGARSSFLIPEDIDGRLKNGSLERYNDQYARFNCITSDLKEIQYLIDLINKYHRCYDQEGYIQKKNNFMNISTGIYEQIINRLFKLKLDEVDAERFYIGKKAIAKDEAIRILSKYLQHLIEVAFIGTPDDQDADKYTEFVNSVIKTLGREFNVEDTELDLIDAQKNILTAVVDRTNCEYPDIEEHLRAITPITSLSRSALFFGGRGPADMESELNREILCADEICWVVSFIKTSGLNLLWNSLRKFTQAGKRLRIITTTYTGATDYDAIARLATLPNTEIKISYDGTQDRLHAKSYIFIRNSGFHTAYIGSSNLSHYALKDGKEWNFKATQFELPQVIEEVRNSFEAYWCDETFEYFIPEVSDERLKKALGSDWDTPLLDFSALDLMRAKDYQQEVLEKLDVERNVHGHFHNLVVAATGTGKTVIAAFDFKRYREAHPDCHFLFIAHRHEILQQAMQTFRIVLDDPNFGSVWDGTNEPTSYQHVFASKDTLRNRVDNLQLTEDYYDYMVVDEVHHIVAPTYVKLMTCFKPQILLGLTATPERTNEQEDITVFFDGHISAEIRLPAALNAGLLAPFHYYGIPDNVDLSEVKWNGHGYDVAELSRIYTQNDFRTGLILKKMQEYISNSRLHKVRALCFCVDKEHAKFMNAKFTLAGLKTDVLTSDNNDHHRKLVKGRLQAGIINYLFVVDLFNEGVDIPEIDTVLFLRPTESATVFLQQFGRGLRLHKDKDHLTVLDFVGHSRAEFSYKERFESLIGRHSRDILTEVKEGFQNAPFGCKIILEEKAKEEIISNIEGYLRSLNKNRIVKEIAAYHEVCGEKFSLAGFLAYSHVPFHKIYGSLTWGELCQLAGVQKEVSSHVSLIKFAVTKKWLATDSFSYFSQLLKFAECGFKCNTSNFSEQERRSAVMLYYDLFDKAGNYSSVAEMFQDLAADQLFVNELKEVLTFLRDRCSAPEKNDNSVYSEWNPLRLHGVYTKAQIQAALGLSMIERKSPSREGVERLKDIKLEAMYVDVIKKREEGSMTAYKDYAQNREFFHWETQNRVREGSREAEAYRNGENNMLLFVRQQVDHPDYGCRMGFVYLGQVTMKSIEGSKPMQIVWHLNTPMSEATYAFASQYKAIG